ncbi:hypothetical protein HPB52_011208 [Rhipicephalus sanguineus]|uniref:Uncharacterized protein n=1 Tax=Rhipicephalus sanguineus TaxID=34632 RepID=A0A9D4YNM5_RHISA|nr:hypothetical protein HPB52_011208 [Rhipicephalus sanguineus]
MVAPLAARWPPPSGGRRREIKEAVARRFRAYFRRFAASRGGTPSSAPLPAPAAVSVEKMLLSDYAMSLSDPERRRYHIKVAKCGSDDPLALSDDQFTYDVGCYPSVDRADINDILFTGQVS